MKNKDIYKSQKKQQNDFLTAFRDFENKIEDKFQDMWLKTFHRNNVPDFFSYDSLGSMPKIDVINRKKDVLVKAELPGIDKKDLDISITNNQLVIKAKTCHEEKEEKGDYLKREISKSEIYRSVLLPADVDDSKIKTSFRNGMLKLTIPKRKNSSRKSIKVK